MEIKFQNKSVKSSNKIVITSVATLVLFGLAAAWSIQAAGIGHGSYIPMLVLFPFSSTAMGLMAQDEALYAIVGWVVPGLAFLQFGIYGFYIGRAWLKGRAKKAFLILSIFHGAVLLVLAIVFVLEFFLFKRQ